jgi:Uma2 family endonuclease
VRAITAAEREASETPGEDLDMQTVETALTVRTTKSPPAQRILLTDVSWKTYECLLADYTSRSVPHFTYDRGLLEIMSPSHDHEMDNRTLAMLVEEVAVELSIDVPNVGSMTFKRQDLQRGFEPDTGFYIRNYELVRFRKQIDLAVDPPPDLIIEIEVTNPALPKIPLYAAMGVPEVWRADERRVTIHRLDGDAYVEIAASAALPPLTSADLTRFLIESQTLRRTEWVRSVRAWAGERSTSAG